MLLVVQLELEINSMLDNQFVLEDDFVHLLAEKLQRGYISLAIFNLSAADLLENVINAFISFAEKLLLCIILQYLKYLSMQTENHVDSYNVIFGRHKLYEHLLLEVSFPDKW